MDALLAFRTTHHAILAERLLLDAAVPARVMPLPGAIAAGCGICLRVPAEERGSAAALLEHGGAAPQGIFLPVSGTPSGRAFKPFPAPIFSEALGLAAGDAVALVGCGGKTALANRLAMENRHLPVLFSTTTRILEPPPEVTDSRLTEPDAADGVCPLPPGVHLACAPAGEKLCGVSPSALARLRPADGLTLLEADGSRGLPLKGWAEHEPVVPEFVSTAVGVCALWPLGLAFRPELAHRPELFREAAGIRDGERISPEHIAAMVKKMFQKAAGRRILFINQTETPELERAAEEFAERCAGMRVVAGSVAEGRGWLLANPM